MQCTFQSQSFPKPSPRNLSLIKLGRAEYKIYYFSFHKVSISEEIPSNLASVHGPLTFKHYKNTAPLRFVFTNYLLKSVKELVVRIVLRAGIA